MGEFQNKTVFVTGATSGMGRATAVAFAREDAMVFGCGRRADEGRKTLALMKDAGREGRFVQLDLADESAVASAVEGIVASHGRLDFAANCAGVDISSALADYTEAQYDAIFNANVRGLFFCVKHEVAAMQRAGRGVIVNVTSVAGHRAYAGNILYNASKSAASMLTRSAALECGKMGIRVNELAPGPIETPMLEEYLRRAADTGSRFTSENLAASLPLGRIGTPEDVAAAILFLCSGAAHFTTGACLTVDGGLLLV